MEYDIALIQQTIIFNGLSAFEVKQVFEECARLKEFAPREKIIEEGSVNDDLYFLPKGKVQVDLELNNAPSRKLNIFEGPIVLGEISFLDKSPRSATIKAVEKLSVYIINGQSLDELIKEMPHTGHKIKHNIALSVSKTIRHMNELLTREMQSNQFLQKKTAEIGAHKYSETVADLAYRINLSV
jgi:CRP/FNR family transcriptional regulator, cyclic AMP receptor protein